MNTDEYGSAMPEWLLNDTLLVIDSEQHKTKAYIRILVYLLGSIASGALLFVSLQLFGIAIADSGFKEILTLISSDPLFILSNIKEYSLSLLETFPLFTSIGVVGSTLLLLIFLRNLIRVARATAQCKYTPDK